MPGSLFPRSPSLEPDLHREKQDARRVHFPPGVPSPKHRSLYAPASSDAGPSHSQHRLYPDLPSEHAEPPRTPSSPFRPPLVGSVKEAVRMFRDDPDEANPELLLPKETTSPISKIRSPSRRHGSVRSDERGSPAFSPGSPRKDKGKGKAREGDLSRHEVQDFTSELPSQDEDEEEHSREHYGDISLGTMRTKVRGKELELDKARERERQRDEAGSDADHDDDERRRDKQRIRLLEEEIQRLRAELAKRPVESSSSQSTIASSQETYIPPPPPPPPLPSISTATMTPRTIILSRSQTHPTHSSTDPLLAAARASLKHTEPPVEAPINPLIPVPASRAKRTGRPTVALSHDKMAAFLQEMKSVRLRKVYHDVDGGRAREYDPDASFAGANVTFAAPADWGASWKEAGKETEAEGKRAEASRPLRRRATIGGTAPSPETTAKGNTATSHMRKEGAIIARRAGGTTQTTAQPPKQDANVNTGTVVRQDRVDTGTEGHGAGSRTSEKRKRQESDAGAVHERDTRSVPKKRMAEASAELSTSTTFTEPSTNQPRHHTAWLRKSASNPSFKPSRIPRLASSSEKDQQATPSLCSDNEAEQDGETSSDKMPATPPGGPTRHAAENPSPVALDDTRSAPHVNPRNRTISAVREDVFAKRPPTSPIPRDTPSRPRPPGSVRKSRSLSQPTSIARTESDDPLALPATMPPPARPAASRIPQRHAQPFRPKRRSRGSPSPPPPSRRQSAPVPAVDDMDVERRRFAKAARDKNADKLPEQTPDLSRSVRRSSLAHLQRQRDAEEDSFWGVLEAEEMEVPLRDEGEEDLDVDSGVLVAVGSRSKKRGFLAHGGAGGPSVFMGVGYVDGAQESDVTSE
ncbi:hypothetical protein PUNSTDRAFT_116231 [Punctularia strigosozonata HHB-11173 SS5]|uniref:Uncharacterized protein n=1 Tax=Punctularia strigosozonata (strain HHB-11173) TaxID=741275 RepID=R7S4Y3_PUNST|nr:uncharacterized protein PUNSTDRAFT_116231 [Punctularia strigosozonata HHB-11173 SS5]EIN04949.1 hypothetical protein PUNSTDRAFT_116231 [Punctularia strigosozonata HHB-11173 SS5]